MIVVKKWNVPLERTKLERTKNVWEFAWVRWVHHVAGIVYCIECLQLDGCYFLYINAPACPLHENVIVCLKRSIILLFRERRLNQ